MRLSADLARYLVAESLELRAVVSSGPRAEVLFESRGDQRLDGIGNPALSFGPIPLLDAVLPPGLPEDCNLDAQEERSSVHAWQIEKELAHVGLSYEPLGDPSGAHGHHAAQDEGADDGEEDEGREYEFHGGPTGTGPIQPSSR